MTKNKSLIKNISLILLSAIFVVLGIFSIIIKLEARKMCFNSVHADTTTTNFYGSSFYVPAQVYYYDYIYSWNEQTWTGLTSFSGQNVWTDGVDYYYSASSNQYVLDISTHTWSTMTWTGLTSFSGFNVWTDGVNYYYSSGTSQRVLNVSTHTWSTMTWTGLTSFDGQYTWFDGVNYYYSNGNNQYVLNVSTHTWSTMTWTGLTNSDGRYFWTDGVDIYYSNNTNQFVLDISTHTWSAMSWYGLGTLNVSGQVVWTDGVNYYYSNGANQFLLDVSTHTWSSITWTGLISFSGLSIWSDGVDYYYSSSANQYFLNNSYSFINEYNNMVFTSNTFDFVQDASGFNVSIHSLIYSFFTGEVCYSASNQIILYDDNLTLAQNVAKCLDDTNYLDYFTIDSTSTTNKVLVPFRFYNQDGFVRFGCFYFIYNTTGLTSNDFTVVNFNSAVNTDGSYPDIPRVVMNYLTYTNEFSENVKFTFEYRAYGLTEVYYNADSFDYLHKIIDHLANYQPPLDMRIWARFNNRTYYLTPSSAQGSIDAYNNGYNIGRQTGYNEGYDYASRVVGQAQYNSGYSAGYVAGSNAGASYTFLGLISAVIDAPVQYFTNLFNFEILGTNISNFILALFTFTIIIVILKKVI